MSKKLLLFLFFLCSFSTLFAQIEFEKRWESFQEKRAFKPFEIGKSDAVLQKEFEEIDKTRRLLWQNQDFELATHLIQNDLVRAPGCCAFAYNNTASYYNASTIYIANKTFIASEGPRSKDIPAFFRLMFEEQVQTLVRLTDSYEGDVKKCHPYWLGHAMGSYIEIFPTYKIKAFDLAHWKDNQGIDPKDLIYLIEEVKKEQGLSLVHCSAGVGRTGTFLAAFAIIDAIDHEEIFSIEEIVYRLSLQRIHSVGKSSQYITLHRLAEQYEQMR